jgi:hypothetical protein
MPKEVVIVSLSVMDDLRPKRIESQSAAEGIRSRNGVLASAGCIQSGTIPEEKREPVSDIDTAAADSLT